MTPEQTVTVLAKCAAFDRRTVGRADVLAWHEVLSDLDFAVALEAVKRWYTNNRDWIMPSDVRALAVEIRRERHRDALDAPPTDTGPLTDRSAEIQAFIAGVRSSLPKGDPGALRHGHSRWRANRERLQRAQDRNRGRASA